MTAFSITVLLLASFFVLCPLRRRNSAINELYQRVRVPLARVGLNHTAWTMFSKGTNRNHFMLLRVVSPIDSRVFEFRDPWKDRSFWGDLVDERLRRIVLTIVQADTGPKTREELARGLVRWCIAFRVTLPTGEFDGEAVYGQEVFQYPDSSKRQPDILRSVCHVVRFTVGTNGHVSFIA